MRKRYIVTFYKTVCGHYGRDRDVRERVVEVFADGREEAVESAKDEFCQHSKIADWKLHADRYTVEEPDMPS